MTRFTIMSEYYEKMESMAHKHDFESTLVPTSLKIRLEDLAFLTALSKKVGESRNSIVSTILHDSLQEEIQDMTSSDLFAIGKLADEETKLLYKKHLKDIEPRTHYLLRQYEQYEKTMNKSSPTEEDIKKEIEDEQKWLSEE